MKNPQRTYIAIDLKSFYASVECVERGLDPLTTNLVVADKSRTDKTICLAVSPSLKQYGIGGRARLFEVVRRVRQINAQRRGRARDYRLTGKSFSDLDLRAHPDWEVDYIAAPPRMAHYMAFSAKIYEIYLKYVAPEDIHVYSIDEVFMDVTAYLGTYKMTAHELAMTMIRDVLKQTGITATAGIGTNMYLCKVAMDIMAKKQPADRDGVRIAELDEMSYRRQLWDHKPLTDFWRVGRGIAQRLAQYGIDTMGKIARCSVQNEELLYRLFGVNAELLIDHAWGWEPCTIDLVKAYRPESNSFSNGQVLSTPYPVKKARVVMLEMADAMSLKLVDKRLVTDQIVLNVGYDAENMTKRWTTTGGRCPRVPTAASDLTTPPRRRGRFSSIRHSFSTASSIRICWSATSTSRSTMWYARSLRKSEERPSWTFSPTMRRRSGRKRRKTRHWRRSAGCRRRSWPSRSGSAKTPSSKG